MRIRKLSCFILSLIIAAAGVFSLVSCARKINYLKADIGKYIELSESDYKNFELNMDFDEVGEADVERKIMNLLYQNKDKDPQYNGGNLMNVPISIGDTVWLYYRGYTVDENGVQTDINGASNFFSSVQSLDIGSLGFIAGFEESLIGKNPIEYEQFDFKEKGAVAEGDVIYLTYRALLPNGTTRSGTRERIDLSKSDVDARYGDGFRELFTGAEIGKTLDSTTLKYDTGSIVYYDIKVEYATSCESAPLTIIAHFPHDYAERSLRGKDVYFDVYVKYINVYNVPEYNDSFIKETLKISEEELSDFEGESLTDKHRAYLFAEAKAENEEERRTLTEEALWECFADKVKVKKLPKADVVEVYDEYYYEALTLYNTYYSGSYSSVAAFAAQYYQITDGTNWLDYIQKQAESVITEKLMFYYIVKRENLLPSKEEYNALYEEVTAEYLEYYANKIYKTELDKITDSAEKEKRLLEIKEEMLDYYGEEYFAEMVYYDYAMDAIIAFGKII